MKPSPEQDEVPPLGSVFDFIRSVWRINRGLELVSKRMLDELGVTGPQRLAVRMIGRFPGITAGQLTKILHIDPSTASSLLRRLVENRIITREEDPDDRRRAPLDLTQKGRRIAAPSPHTIEAAVSGVLRRFSERDLDAAQRVMLALAQALEREAGAARAEEAAP